jgi:hypothetical protein
MNVDSVQQRARNTLPVSLDLPRRAAALALHVAVVAAGVWVSF